MISRRQFLLGTTALAGAVVLPWVNAPSHSGKWVPIENVEPTDTEWSTVAWKATVRAEIVHPDWIKAIHIEEE